ncbi:MAG: GGDEF domain-containing protein, partial [Planctomycetaceae bacterium]|nr:GGDEF domain-containing protein [Planctomycetaceae bacterium]
MITSADPAIPTLPTVAVRLLELYDDPDVELSDVVELLRTDPAITAKIIKAANTPAYGIGREVTDLRQAVSLLGKSIVAPLALSFSLSDKSMQSPEAADLFRQYWLQAIVQAITAECLAKKYAKSSVGEWFVSGLLSSIGRLALINHDAELYKKVMSHADENRVSLHEAEAALLPTTTIEFSAQLMQKWNLPSRWIDATSYQVRLVENLESLPDSDVKHGPLIVGVATAAAVGNYFCRNFQGESLIRIVHLMEEGFGATEEDVDALIETVRERVDAVSHLFQVKSAMQGSPTQLMSIAMQHLATMALRSAMAQQRNEQPSKELLQQNGSLLERIERLMHRSTIDPLTGVYNRGYFDDRFSEQIAEMIPQSKAIAILFADVDHFKSINDTLGHLAGDAVLRKLAEALKGAIRNNDLLARYGGEEFVLMVHDPRPEELAHLGERLRKRVEQQQFSHEGTIIPVTISIGAALGRPYSVINGFGDRLIAA